MQTINQLLQNKGTHVETLAADATVYKALEVMADKGIGSVLVMRDDKPIGLFSERDYARNIVLKGRNSRETKVSEAMSAQVVVVDPKQSIEECMAIMTEKRVRHLPVIENDRLIGIISIGDLVKAIIENQQFVIEQLVSYIHS
ncbi:MAG: CBS domain-containing protein [Candidatus Thiodiazotropha sp.]|jgi:CBS domain-containing protein